ncbi:hypothetical protein OSB04_006827 [Centaurea solstitialis]|uniref:Uncharacterized protein n=1 Tax=Centaurea solstitialis TaxID=347529 RepID=A0AA38WHV8_9ASTR|nr:hypothetical protein OSB04_006827 [Centaurea solstitialis]
MAFWASTSEFPSWHHLTIRNKITKTRTADELSKIMAFFYYGAAKPSCLDDTFVMGNDDIPDFPAAPIRSKIQIRVMAGKNFELGVGYSYNVGS